MPAVVLDTHALTEWAARRQRQAEASVVDAVVAVTAATMGATAVLTSDPADLAGLLADTAVRVVTI